MPDFDQYEAIIGLELHVQLSTQSKAFSSDQARYGAPPNTLISPISMGHPGTLPKMNKRVIEYAIKLGLACNCKINKYNRFARKNYFYADLPKGYQISQYDTPICSDGTVILHKEQGSMQVGITRIHMEEDSGKSIHEQDPYYSLIDLNRAGVPLLELVTEPDMRTPQEAYRFVQKLRQLVRYLEISDGNMEEGSLRCDANVSVRPKSDESFGDKVEVKNMNSMRNVQRALEFEIKRQIEKIEEGGTIQQDTRGFNAVEGYTFTMRSKEMAHDYRFFPEPDLPPIKIEPATIEAIQKEMPALPEELYNKYTEQLGLPAYDAKVITDDKGTALFFESIIEHTDHYKAASNWVMGPIRSYLNDKAVTMERFPIPAAKIAQLIELVESDKVSNSKAEQEIYPEMLESPKADPEQIAEEKNIIQDIAEEEIKELIDEVLKNHPDKVEEYKNGKKGLIGMFMGRIMEKTKGKANPKVANQLLEKTLEEK